MNTGWFGGPFSLGNERYFPGHNQFRRVRDVTEYRDGLNIRSSGRSSMRKMGQPSEWRTKREPERRASINDEVQIPMDLNTRDSTVLISWHHASHGWLNAEHFNVVR